jgi:DNA replication protein DnaC
MDGQGERQQTSGGERRSSLASLQPTLKSLRFTSTPALAQSMVHPRYNFPALHVAKRGELVGLIGQPFDTLCESILTKAREGGLLALLGDRGTGKTQAATEVAARFLSHWRAPVEDSKRWRPTAIRYTTAAEMFLDIRTGMANGEEWEVLRLYKTCGLLVIDEIQERKQTDFEDQVLVSVIDTRYMNMRPTILIGNQTEEKFRVQLGPSVASRMTEGASGVVRLTGPSYRRPS